MLISKPDEIVFNLEVLNLHPKILTEQEQWRSNTKQTYNVLFRHIIARQRPGENKELMRLTI